MPYEFEYKSPRDMVPVPMVGSVIVFKQGTSKATALAALKKLHDIVDHSQTHDFDANWGGPVWYIP